MSIIAPWLLCILFLITNGGHLTLTLGLKQEDANMTSSCIEKERLALLDVKANLFDFHRYIADWGSENMDCCKWVGVRCSNHTGHVIELNLKVPHPSGDIIHDYEGTISPLLQVLNHLRYLILGRIDFQSHPLPSFLGALSNLRLLHISGSNLSGFIPYELGNLSKLVHLDLGQNSLKGPVPHQLGNLSNLLYLDLGNNFLRGSIPFSFGDLTRLTYLNLSQNHIGGIIPKSFGNSSSLIHLDLSHNLLNGSLPSFSRCSSLISLSLANNSLKGRMSDLIGFSSLRVLDLSSNHLFGNVPNSLGQISDLRYLDLSSNSLQGTISQDHFLNLTKLGYLDLSLNSLVLNLSFEGRIPPQLSVIKLQSCKLGLEFPRWLKTQRIFTHLDISRGGISDYIPMWFWDLPIELEFLNLSSNHLKGKLPDITSSFIGFPGMDLSNNHFEGMIPSLPSSLASLNLSGNKFSGELSFFKYMYGFLLTFLDLSNNLLSGSLSDDWFYNKRLLIVLNLSKNNLSGKIPSAFGRLSKLEALYLRSNSFVGELPMALRWCTKLKFLDLRENNLSGVIPEWIGEGFLGLQVLVLGSNRFYGGLPSQICWLYNLQVLDLSNNGFSGNIPRCFYNFTAMARKSIGDDMPSHSYYSYLRPYKLGEGNRQDRRISRSCGSNYWSWFFKSHEENYFLDNTWGTWKGTERSFERNNLQLMRSIDLSRNNFSGILPHEITSLYELMSLNISKNRLHGEVTKDMGLLNFLESLDLSRNEFSGNIPRSLANLTFLSYLDLSFNDFSGRIPTGPQLQRLDCTSYIGNPQLSGPPLTLGCGFPPPPGNKYVEEDGDDLWKSCYTGMGVGFAVGFWGICGALFLNHRSRYLFFASLCHMKDWIYVMVVVHFGKLERKFRKCMNQKP